MEMTEQRDALIKEWLKEATKKIKESLKHDLEVEVKSSPNDLVTQMDRKIEKELVEKIKQHFQKDFEQKTVWFLDPIDGTLNFVLQNENYAVMLAVYEKGVGKQAYIYDVTHNKLYWGIKNKGVYCNEQRLPKMEDLPLAKGLFAS